MIITIVIAIVFIALMFAPIGQGISKFLVGDELTFKSDWGLPQFFSGISNALDWSITGAPYELNMAEIEVYSQTTKSTNKELLDNSKNSIIKVSKLEKPSLGSLGVKTHTNKIMGIDVELQIFLTCSAISENEIKPVSGIPKRVEETLKPDINPTLKPSLLLSKINQFPVAVDGFSSINAGLNPV